GGPVKCEMGEGIRGDNIRMYRQYVDNCKYGHEGRQPLSYEDWCLRYPIFCWDLSDREFWPSSGNGNPSYNLNAQQSAPVPVRTKVEQRDGTASPADIAAG